MLGLEMVGGLVTKTATSVSPISVSQKNGFLFSLIPLV